MADRAVLTIGGEEIQLPVMSLHAIRVWGKNARRLSGRAVAGEAVEDMSDDAIQATLEVISAALEDTPQAMTPDAMERRIKGFAEAQKLNGTLVDLLAISGFENGTADSGEAGPAGQADATSAQ